MILRRTFEATLGRGVVSRVLSDRRSTQPGCETYVHRSWPVSSFRGDSEILQPRLLALLERWHFVRLQGMKPSPIFTEGLQVLKVDPPAKTQAIGLAFHTHTHPYVVQGCTCNPKPSETVGYRPFIYERVNP